MKESPLIVTRGDGVPLPDQRAAVEEFKRQCLRPDITVRELQEQVHAFAEETFGPGREDAAWKKLFEEIGETLKNPRDPGEWADIFIVLLDLAKMYGVDVGSASVDKMAVNRQRVWTKTETGVMQHVAGAEKLPEAHYHALFEGGPLAQTGSHVLPGEAPSASCPAGHIGPGAYLLSRKDRGLDGKTLFVYKWDPDMGVPF